MELKEFISETLKQITEGIQDAQQHIKDSKMTATINPRKSREEIENIEFDIAVTTNTNKKGGANGGIKVAGILSAGGDFSKSKSIENVSRIKFKVQVEFPRQEDDIVKPRVITTLPERKSKHSY